MRRRDFLAQLAGASVALGSAGSAFAYIKKKRHTAPSPPPRLERIAISSWSLHNYFRSTRANSFDLPGPLLALLDFPEMIVARYQVRHFELCATHFPSTEPAFLRELKYTLAHTLSTIVNLSVDIGECGPEGTFSDPDHEARLAALDAARRWVDVAHDLGVKSVSVGPGKVDPESLARTGESYKALAIYAQTKGVHVMMENQLGFGGEHPQEITKVLKLAGPGRLSALPDFANFTDEPTRQKGLEMLFPYAPSLCHVKGLEFDAAGAETGYDFPQAMAIARTAGFRGVYAINFDGPGDPYAGIQKTLDELLKYL
jgi:sugar phosphate isomerase/epimerase